MRELREELGIEAMVGAALIDVPQRYPHKRLRLDVRDIASWSGRPRGLDGQALAWVPPRKLADYPMPPADRPVVAALLQPAEYLVTPTPGADTVPLAAFRGATIGAEPSRGSELVISLPRSVVSAFHGAGSISWPMAGVVPAGFE